eukprot:1715692-Rhodomonas_salina.1
MKYQARRTTETDRYGPAEWSMAAEYVEALMASAAQVRPLSPCPPPTPCRYADTVGCYPPTP